ncbi:MAG: DNA polymerase III subunit alpha, partial [Spirochaetales bacterium]
VMEKQKERFRKGAVENGFTEEHADEIFDIMIPFAGYGFNKSHAAAYSVLAYRTAYLKANFPAEFIAANLTNEISSTDKLPVYIAEGRSMGIAIDPPDVNRSDKVFNVVDGRIVYGLMGIKGLGETAAEEIVNQRTENGSFTDFMDFLQRVNVHTVNKRALEVLIRTGAFDTLGLNRPTLLENMGRAVDYVCNIKNQSASGQVSLFEDTDEVEFAPFVFEHTEDWPQSEKLRIEKELIGFYISGHPLDPYKKIIERSVTLTTQTLEQARKEKSYTILGTVKELRQIVTKKGIPMAFAKLEDMEGSVDITFFPKLWETVRSRIADDVVIALAGKIDLSRNEPSVLVDEILDMENLQEKSFKEVHIQIFPVNSKEDAQRSLSDLQDFLTGKEGGCSVFLHMKSEGKQYTINPQLAFGVPSDDDFLECLQENSSVQYAWAE